MGDFNSKEYSFADVKVSVLGANLSGLRGLIYKKAQEKEVVYGQGNEGKAIQRGNKKYDGTLSLLQSDYDLMHKAAVAAGYEDLVDVPGKLLNITCVYQKDGDAGLSTVAIINAEFTEVEEGMKQNDKFKEISLPFIALKIRKF